MSKQLYVDIEAGAADGECIDCRASAQYAGGRCEPCALRDIIAMAKRRVERDQETIAWAEARLAKLT